LTFSILVRYCYRHKQAEWTWKTRNLHCRWKFIRYCSGHFPLVPSRWCVVTIWFCNWSCTIPFLFVSAFDELSVHNTPSDYILEVVYDSDTITKAQLWLLISIKIFFGKLYICILMKVIFKTNVIIWFSNFQTQRLKSHSWFIFSILTQTLSKRLLIWNQSEYSIYLKVEC
jgi:hypothetical protein